MNADLKEMTDAMVLAAQPERVILFGSHAKGTATEFSDYDLALVFPTREQVRVGLKSANRALWPRRVPVDLVGFSRETWVNGNSSLAREVAKDGQTLYSKG